ncbi:NAD(P)-dependent oxidoreductase [Variovorax sp. OV329]|uniref:NAD-dependent epimerase/dehydratase family protein n=1 Tax=Variovorax sp. OV329 TaxID=1882825 RepID=UPI0008F3EE9A|nr:NAD(P)-dependent oxidoreductase [Variovorax sp. OV329]SFM94579.1 Nucleoside-diphosphate-sugar epimerase [Variovorax sp. OV329]
MLVGLTGATGYVGRFIAQELHQRGVAVRALARAESDRTGFAGPIEWHDGSLGSDDELLARFVAGTDAVVHCALEHVPGRYRGGEGTDLSRFIEMNVGGSLRLMQAARSSGVGRFIFLSSRAAYGDAAGDADLGSLLHDDSAARPHTHYGACKAAVDAFVSSWGRGGGWDICALRPTGVYGVVHPPARTKWLSLVDAIRRGQPWPECRRASEVHGRDVARAVWMLLGAPDIAGRTFNCSDVLVSTADIARIVQRLTGARGPFPPEPSGPWSRVMACEGLQARGFVFGGMPLLEATVAQIISMLEQQGRRPQPRRARMARLPRKSR